MRIYAAWFGLFLVSTLVLQGCSETTRRSMGRDVNRAASDVDQKVEDL